MTFMCNSLIIVIKHVLVLPLQIHWPVSERRRTECLVSGKDASVSMFEDSAYKLSRVVQYG